MARHLDLNLDAVKDKSGMIDESKVTIEGYEAQLVFGKDGNIPAKAVRKPEEVWRLLRSLQQ
jgi:hypothetical protein